MKRLQDKLRSLPHVMQLETLLREGEQPIAVTGLSQEGKALLCWLISIKRKIVLLCADEAGCRRLQRELEGLSVKTVLYPTVDLAFYETQGISGEYVQQRLSALLSLDGAQIVLSTPQAAAQFTLPPDLLRESCIELVRGDTVSPRALAERLIQAGYERSVQVEGPGQFSARGGIMDIFSAGAEYPIRLEFYGDEIDTLHEFDVLTQRRIAKKERAVILPVTQLLPEGGQGGLILRLRAAAQDAAKRRGTAAKASAARLQSLLERAEQGAAPLDCMIPFLWEHPATLFDYVENALVMVDEERACAKAIEEACALHEEELRRAIEEGELCAELTRFALTQGEFWSGLGKRELIFLEALPHGRYELPPRGLVASSERHESGLGSNLSLLLDEVRELLEQNYEIFFLSATERQSETLSQLLRENGVNAAKIRFLTGGLSGGVVYPQSGLAVLSGVAAVQARASRRRSVVQTKGEKIKTYSDLRVGDYVVHQNYGIGRYQGIVQLHVENVTKDYIKILYQGSDVLYVPADQLDLVSKYISGDDNNKVRLSKMGGVEWQKTKQRVRHAARDMAKQLTELYAQRERLPGFAFGEDSDWQSSFEEGFPYVETDDQLRCIDEVKRDMQRPVPMDRLLCGDVGFGKTEVALRAAFKAIENGKQVAMLVPTTILSWQHYTTALSRFSTFPIRIENLSRFRTPRQQADILRRLRTGEIDMVIGTHRLLQKDVVFKDLGLLIVDEEQRFGVGHKERLKEIARSVDVLTLTATPIPRTLGMVLSGIRDMSVINQSPQDRLPVQTYVLEYEEGLIADAIRRELRRGGQVFYLHNRVETIDRVASRLQLRFPEARIRTIHGKMKEEQLSEIWENMVAGEIDILVCTTIIETGVDIPSANTLIVENADHLGLSQLYQIRGRVGRSSRRAYAFFTYQKNKVHSEDASKRLSAIREFTQFGSGSKIAMRDLEIRGAGNVLGAEQHGHMEAVGYDLYLKLLEEAVLEEKGERVDEVNCSVDFVIDANIPVGYIESSELRIDIYKKIAAIKNEEDLSDLYDELCDRFGDVPKQLENLCRTSLLRNRAGAVGVEEMAERSGNLVVDARRLPMEAVMALAASHRGKVLFSAGSKPYLTIRPDKGKNGLETGEWVIDQLEQIAAQAAKEAVQPSFMGREAEKEAPAQS
ncbi:MAG: transcription-repair coupling factor [Clostridia bacterium]|nr:transcription-repair coupling factor [Clostridia bacterium]